MSASLYRQSSDIRNYSVAIIAFGMEGCPHCEEYLPRLVAAVQQAGKPFAIYQQGQFISTDSIPVIIMDAASNHPTVKNTADSLRVESVPVTFLRTSPNLTRFEGALTPDQIKALLILAKSHR
jgi:thiol-disulfide isomerase/thioredoxin